MPYNTVKEMREHYGAVGAGRVLFTAIMAVVDAALEPGEEGFKCFACESTDPNLHGGGCALGHAINLVGIRTDPHKPQICDTTLTERHPVENCQCQTYEGNLGPCKTYEAGVNGRCVYCDHEERCHRQLRVVPKGGSDE